jgi:long-chain acyl-CoA synthetase
MVSLLKQSLIAINPSPTISGSTGGGMKRQIRGLKRSSILLDFNLYRVNVPIHGISGAELSAVDICPEGARKCILFVHGYAGVAETWEYQINHFMDRFRIVAPDLRGHGQSDAPFTQYTMDELVQDLETIIEFLDIKQEIVLVGHSFGGAICLDFAAAHADRLEKLVLIATAAEYPLPKITSLATHLPTAALRPLWRYRPRWNAEVHVMKRMVLNNMRRWKGWDKLENIHIPTLVITGERDRYFPRKVYDQLGTLIPQAQVIDVGASKHKVQLERHQAVNRAIERFMEGEPGAKTSWRASPTSGVKIERRPWLSSYSRHTPKTVPIPAQPLHKFLETSADWLPRRIATIFYDHKLSYRQLDQRANQFAHALHGLGVSPGDRVMLVLPNMPQMLIAYFGTMKIGGVIVLPNPDANAREIIEQMKQTGAKILVTLQEFAGLAEAIKYKLPITVIYASIRNAVSARTYRNLMMRWETAGFSEAQPARGEQALLMDQMLLDAPREAPQVDVSSTQLAAVLFTSGTTDDPKGVRLTHANLVANALQTRHWIPEMRMGEEVFLAVLPFTHSYGMTTAMNIPIVLAGTIILLPVFELDQVLDSIKRYKPSIFPGVPSIYMAINAAPNVRSYGLSSIKACLSGAAPLPVEVQETFEKLTRGRLVEGYGLTEASPVTHSNPFEPSDRTGSIGIPIPNTDAKIVDLVTEADLPPGQIGELIIRGPQVMQGYWGEEGESSVIKDGWLYTGDVAVMDEDGFFQIISRKRDTIMAGEYSVYPRDVEEVLYENSKVLEVAVVGVTGTEGEQRIKAFVVPRPGSQISEDELMALCRGRLEPYAVPWEIEFREELPKSFIGKVLRRMLVEEEP